MGGLIQACGVKHQWLADDQGIALLHTASHSQVPELSSVACRCSVKSLSNFILVCFSNSNRAGEIPVTCGLPPFLAILLTSTGPQEHRIMVGPPHMGLSETQRKSKLIVKKPHLNQNILWTQEKQWCSKNASHQEILNTSWNVREPCVCVCVCVWVRAHARACMLWEPDDSTKVKAYPVHSRAQCVTSHFNCVYIYLNWDMIDT